MKGSYGRTENRIALRQQNMSAALDLLRKSGKVLTDLQQTRGNLIDKDTVLAELAQPAENVGNHAWPDGTRHSDLRSRSIVRSGWSASSLDKKSFRTAIKKVRECEDEIFRISALGEPRQSMIRLDLILQRE